MTEHLSDAELLDLADGRADAAALAHADGCPVCARAAAETNGGRLLVRAALGPLEPPPSIAGAVAKLPRRERPRRRLFAGIALLPVAGAIAAAAFVLTNDGSKSPPQPAAQAQSAVRATGVAPERSVRGPAGEVVGLLRHAGLQARAQSSTLVIVTATPAAVDRVLGRRAPGAVRVQVKPLG